jgi:hypothetical protein
VAQNEDLDVLRGRCAAEQYRPAEQQVEDQAEQAKRDTFAIMLDGWKKADHRR